MTPERAQEIIAQARNTGGAFCMWSDNIEKVMRPGERDEVRKVWDTMPGYTCFVDALNRIAAGAAQP